MNGLASTLPASQARTNFYQILDEVGDKLRQFTITRRGKQKAVIMSAEEYEGWLETLDVISDPQLVASIKRGLKSKKRYTEAEAKRILGW